MTGSLLKPFEKDLHTSIKLHDPRGLGEQYEYGNVIAFRYTNDALPDEALIRIHLEVVLKMLNKLYEEESIELSDRMERMGNLSPQSHIIRESLQPK